MFALYKNVLGFFFSISHKLGKVVINCRVPSTTPFKFNFIFQKICNGKKCLVTGLQEILDTYSTTTEQSTFDLENQFGTTAYGHMGQNYMLV